MADPLPRRGPILSAGALLGIGLGGLFNVLVLHPLMQWNRAIAEVSRFEELWAIGLHMLLWIAAVVGTVGLWRAGKRTDVVWSTNVFGGGGALGWGLFTLVEGVIEHHLLGIHHLRPGSHQLAWDLGFLAFGAALVVLGVVLSRASRASEWQGPITRPQHT